MTYVTLLILYLVFRLKHVICDFILQFDWMALGKGKGFSKGGGSALVSHCLIHAAGTLLIVLFFAPALWWLALCDFVIHALIDRAKAVLTEKKGWKPKDTYFWWAIGIDQEFHNLTHLGFIIYIAMYLGLFSF